MSHKIHTQKMNSNIFIGFFIQANSLFMRYTGHRNIPVWADTVIHQ